MSEICDIPFEEVESIRELWEKNCRYHEKISEYFKEDYANASFVRRMKGFSEYSPENIKITIAKEDGVLIGYCISTIKDGVGELDTLHVDERLRGKGVGKEIVLRHVDWLKKHCKVIGVTVSQENDSTIRFYRKMGFFPNTLYMKMK